MKKATNRKLEKVLNDDLRNLDNLSLVDEKKVRALQSIGKEVSMISSIDKENFERESKQNQREFEERKFEFEKEKFEFEKKSKENQTDIEKNKFDIDKARFEFDIENTKFQNQLTVSKIANDSRMANIQIILSVVSIISTFALGVVGKVIYAKLAANAQKHEYNDYQLEPVSSKENRQNLLK